KSVHYLLTLSFWKLYSMQLHIKLVLAVITDTPPAEADRFDDALVTALAAIESHKICLRLWFN
ncbi:hypothetical protein QUA62_27760, partial [Microcoleus sp. MON1_C1]|uniref:hypothetical protein n=1 Tax=Microcoleus sp. MON1_C1 TaxID=2818827 RepID=UPI002FD08655